MAKIHVYLSIGFPGAVHEDILDIPDDFTDEDKQFTLEEWANQYIDMFYEDVED